MWDVFVYGTLRSGGPLNPILSFLGATLRSSDAVTAARFFMFDNGHYPMLVRPERPNLGHPVKGEVYSCSDVTLRVLDEVESEGSLYRRSVIPLADGSAAWAYIWIPAPGRMAWRVYPSPGGTLDWRPVMADHVRRTKDLEEIRGL